MNRIHKEEQAERIDPPQESISRPCVTGKQGLRRRTGKRNHHRRRRVGLKGFEPLTLRLSSACSNQLSYRPGGREARRRSE